MEKTDVSALGTESMMLEIPAHVVYDFQKLYDWKYAKFGNRKPVTLEAFIASQISDDGQAHAKYAEDSAYRVAEKLVFELAKLKNISPADAATELKIQLREK